MAEAKAAAVRPTDWDQYYQNASTFSRLTRPAVCESLLRAIERYSAPHPAIAELGGAGSCALAPVRQTIQPSLYHIVDSNALGLGLLAGEAAAGDVHLHRQDILHLDLDLQVDTVFSLGLIEHFDVEGTRQAVRSHLQILKPGGIAVITFPTPTLRYRIVRGAITLAGRWMFPDERPLRVPEVAAAVGELGTVVDSWLIGSIPLTQRLIVIRKK